MPSLKEFIQTKVRDGSVSRHINSVTAQFGITTADGQTTNYPFAQVLPLVNKPNLFEEAAMVMRSLIAVDGTRFSAIPLRTSAEDTSSIVALGANDTGMQVDPEMYDQLIELAEGDDVDGAEQVLNNILDSQVIKPLNDIIEKQRVQGIVDGVVKREGPARYKDWVQLENPAGHRATIPAGTQGAPLGWHGPNYDPIQDLRAAKLKLGTVTHIFTTQRIIDILSMNAAIKNRTPLNNVATGAVDEALLAAIFRANGLPAPIVDEEFYDSRQGRKRFLREDAFVMLNSSAVDPESVEDGILLSPTTLGFVGKGIVAGQRTNGRITGFVFSDENYIGQQKAPSFVVEGSQYSFPVIRNRAGAQRLQVYNVPSPTA